MAREYTPIPFEFLEEMDELTDEEYGRLIRAMQAYSIRGEEPDLSGNERLLWKRCRNTVDRYNASYDSRYASNAENGKKGGRPKKSDSSKGFFDNPSGFSENEENPKNPSGFSETQKSQTKSKSKSKYKTNDNTPIAPKGAKRSDAEFEIFWSAYPTKVGKQPARKAFDKVSVPVETLVAAIERQKCSSQWSKDGGQYIPNPATWLNQCRWEDQLTPKQETENERWKRQMDAETAEYIKKYMENESFGIGKKTDGGGA